jgi:hypothetical protein
MNMAPKHEVIKDGHVFEEFNVLEGPGNSKFGPLVGREFCNVHILKINRAFLGTVKAANTVEQRSFSGTIGANYREDFAPIDVKANVRKCLDAAEVQEHIISP